MCACRTCDAASRRARRRARVPPALRMGRHSTRMGRHSRAKPRARARLRPPTASLPPIAPLSSLTSPLLHCARAASKAAVSTAVQRAASSSTAAVAAARRAGADLSMARAASEVSMACV